MNDSYVDNVLFKCSNMDAVHRAYRNGELPPRFPVPAIAYEVAYGYADIWLLNRYSIDPYVIRRFG